MKGMIIFIAVALTVYTSVNWYIHRSVMQMAALSGTWGSVLRWGLLLLILSFPMSRFLYGFPVNPVSNFFIWLGSFWVGIMFYFFFIFLVKDAVRLVNHFAGVIPRSFFTSTPGSQYLILGITGVIAILAVYGTWRSYRPIVNEVHVQLASMQPQSDPIRIAFVSDVHLGAIVGEKRLQKMVSDINALNPDLIVIGGDLLDESASRMVGWEKHLQQLNAPNGVFGVLGNHEYYHDMKGSIQFFRNSGITLLQDQSSILDDKLILLGLEDRPTMGRFSDTIPSVAELMESAKQSTGNEANQLPLIVIHHTPVKLDEAANAGADLQLSGHTHGGQLWPAKMFVKMSYNVVEGLYTLKNGMQLYISPGYGSWGPPMRIGTTPEIALLILEPAH